MSLTHSPTILWEMLPSAKQTTRISRYMRWLYRHYQLDFNKYEELYEWSVEKPAEFWQSLWQYFNVLSYTPYKRILSDDDMPRTRWFEGATLNYVEHIFNGKTDLGPAIKFLSEDTPLSIFSWDTLAYQVANISAFLKQNDVKKGDRIVGYLPNRPEAVVAFLATASLGAIWSSVSPDFETMNAVDRFAPIEPKILFATDGYRYGGESFNRIGIIEDIVQQLPTLIQVVIVPFLDDLFEKMPRKDSFPYTIWQNALDTEGGKLTFQPVEFSYPLCILFTSDTTGSSKTMVFSHGGLLLEHSKYLTFHNDLNAGETLFFYAPTSSMMWHLAVSSLLLGGVLLIYDGSPTYPSLNFLWKLANETQIHHFGTNTAFLVLCMKAKLDTKQQTFKLNHLRSIVSMNSLLPKEVYSYIYQHIKKDVWLIVNYAENDICLVWAGGCALLPVVEGEISCRSLGCALQSWDEKGNPIQNQAGEMAVTKPMPAMPVFFWQDTHFEKYKAAYFNSPPSVWRQNEHVKITDRQSLTIDINDDITNIHNQKTKSKQR